MTTSQVDVVPLVRDVSRQYEAGWCSSGSASTLVDSPEVEIVCGGINTKGPNYAAVWRQGNLLHFGFEQSPAEMNDTGRALLINSIHYISRFTEDRPIARTPSVFNNAAWFRSRDSVDRMFEEKTADKQYLEYYFAKSCLAAGNMNDLTSFRTWYEANRSYLHAGADGLLAIDEEARTVGLAFSSTNFFEKAFAMVQTGGDKAEAVRRLLNRYAPEGPEVIAPLEKWQSWWKENAPYLFFTDFGGYRWMTDPLAKKRGIPTARLRGAARATLPLLETISNIPRP